MDDLKNLDKVMDDLKNLNKVMDDLKNLDKVMDDLKREKLVVPRLNCTAEKKTEKQRFHWEQVFHL